MQDQYRYYKNKYKEEVSNEALDRIGIEVTRTNAQTVKQIFGNITHPLLYSNHDKPMPTNFKKILFGGGWKPGAR